MQCRRSSPVCARCGPILEPPPIVPAKSGGRADAPPKQGGFPHKDAHSKTRPKDDGTEAVNMQKAKYQVMLDEEEQALRRMIEVETQKLYKAQKWVNSCLHYSNLHLFDFAGMQNLPMRLPYSKKQC